MKANLEQRKNELHKQREKIDELLNDFDNDNESAIKFLFEHLSLKFSKLFATVTNGGIGRLVLVKNHRNASDEMECDELQIYMKFTANSADDRNFDDLSNEEKCLVAAIFILAIQQYNPARFYLFDGIDEVTKRI